MTYSPMDLLVIGSGVAGLTAAVGALAREPGIKVGVLSKAELSVSATQWAQGGVAAVLGDMARPGDSIELHLADTLAAGAGLCDVAATRLVVTEGPGRVRELARQGASFDTDPDGSLALAREGGHSQARVVHAGGAATGAEIERTLVAATRSGASELLEGWYALDLIVEGGTCRGVLALDPDGRVAVLRAEHTILATGGAGQLFDVTTNPPQATGDGIAMALRADVAVADIEFMQFHPTALHDSVMPRPLLSEALRGEGALLRDGGGRRFVDELAPRDVVSRAIAARMLDEGVDHVWLDATGIANFAAHFPSLLPPLARLGIDPARDWLPVAPAAHYLSGGVVTDLNGATTLPHLWAAGETACTGVHGANRLASNSLLEGMVFAARVVDAILAGRAGPEPSGVMAAVLDAAPVGGMAVEDHLPVVRIQGSAGRRRELQATFERNLQGHEIAEEPVPADQSSSRPVGGDAAPAESEHRSEPDISKTRECLQQAMTHGAGVVRSERSLDQVAARLDELSAPGPLDTPSPFGAELVNLLTVAGALVSSARERKESRGAHSRSDFPDSDRHQRVRYVQ